MSFLSEINSPTLLLDEGVCRANIRSMAQKAGALDLLFKPHFKTHQSADIGKWFAEEGVEAITVSSLDMAEYFSDNGWQDITVAFPFNIRESGRLQRLASSVRLTLLANERSPITELDQFLDETVNILVEINAGAQRSGMNTDDPDRIDRIVGNLEKTDMLQFQGFYSHPGHSYSARSAGEIKSIHRDVMDQMKLLDRRYRPAYPELEICVGDTPCCSAAEEFGPVSAISPGNFVFYDLMQDSIGSCSKQQIAVALACPVVDKYPSRNELIIHGGAIHLSKDILNHNGTEVYGLPVFINEEGWEMPREGCYVKALSQEHGVVKGSSDWIRSVQVGQLIGILPVHSCLTADLMMGYRTLDGKSLNHIRKR